MNKIETKDLTVDVLTQSLKEFDDLKKEIKKDNVIDGKDIISKIDKKINALKDKAYDVVIASLNPSYEECLLSEDEIASAARSTLEGYVSQLQTDIETVNGSELLSSDQKEKFASEANNYISLYNQKIEELKQQEAAEAAKKKEQQQAQAASNNSSAGSSALAASASGGRSGINGYEVPLDDIQRHINAGHNLYVDEWGSAWYCLTDEMHWTKGYQY